MNPKVTFNTTSKHENTIPTISHLGISLVVLRVKKGCCLVWATTGSFVLIAVAVVAFWAFSSVSSFASPWLPCSWRLYHLSFYVSPVICGAMIVTVQIVVLILNVQHVAKRLSVVYVHNFWSIVVVRIKNLIGIDWISFVLSGLSGLISDN